MQRFIFCRNIFTISNAFQMLGNVADLNSVKVKDLATRKNSWDHLVLFRGRQDEDGIRWRLFKRFKESVESCIREHVNLIDDINLKFSKLRWITDLIDQV